MSTAHPPHLHPSQSYQFAPNCTDEDSWNKCMDAVRKHDHEMCKGWVKNLDALLVFAGLFTAVVTAFTVDSYHWLLPDNDELTVQLLQQISKQLANSSYAVTQLPGAEDDFVPSAAAIRINAFWFLSIALALSSALITILCKQWIQEYARDPALSSKEALEFRQLRFQGLEKWKLPAVLATPSLLVQAALLLFFAGLLDMLWQYKSFYYIAVLVTIFIGVVMIAIGFTTLASTTYLALNVSFSQVSRNEGDSGQKFTSSVLDFFPYKSPHASIFYQVLTLFIRALRRMFSRNTDLNATLTRGLSVQTSWRSIERNIHMRVAEEGSVLDALAWVYDEVEHDTEMTNHILHCISAEYAHSNGGRNRNAFLHLFKKVCETPYLYHHEDADISRRFRIELITQSLCDLVDRTKDIGNHSLLQWAEDVVKILVPLLWLNVPFSSPSSHLRTVSQDNSSQRQPSDMRSSRRKIPIALPLDRKRWTSALADLLRQGLVPPDNRNMGIIWELIWPLSLPLSALPDPEVVMDCYDAIPHWFRRREHAGYQHDGAHVQNAAHGLLQRLEGSGLDWANNPSPYVARALESLDKLMREIGIDSRNIHIGLPLHPTTWLDAIARLRRGSGAKRMPSPEIPRNTVDVNAPRVFPSEEFVSSPASTVGSMVKFKRGEAEESEESG